MEDAKEIKSLFLSLLLFTILCEIFACMGFFSGGRGEGYSNHRGSHIPSSWMVSLELYLLLAFTRQGHEYQALLSPRARPRFILSSERVF